MYFLEFIIEKIEYYSLDFGNVKAVSKDVEEEKQTKNK